MSVNPRTGKYTSVWPGARQRPFVLAAHARRGTLSTSEG